jgi:flagellar basal body rod protein FlgG
MIYGLYLSATGVMTNSYRQDVIANNIANAETVGFKKDLALFDQRLTEAQQRRLSTSGPLSPTSKLLENLGGGLLAHPTAIDTGQGEFEPTGSPLDMAIEGDGFFAVNAGGETRLTRNGQFAIDSAGHLTLSNARGEQVLDVEKQPIQLEPGGYVRIDKEGTVTQFGRPVARLGVFDVADRSKLAKQGGTLIGYGAQDLQAATHATLHPEATERANVDSATELSALMDTQRQLEANANMIRYQDQTLAKLVNEVGKLG